MKEEPEAKPKHEFKDGGKARCINIDDYWAEKCDLEVGKVYDIVYVFDPHDLKLKGAEYSVTVDCFEPVTESEVEEKPIFCRGIDVSGGFIDHVERGYMVQQGFSEYDFVRDMPLVKIETLDNRQLIKVMEEARKGADCDYSSEYIEACHLIRTTIDEYLNPPAEKPKFDRDSLSERDKTEGFMNWVNTMEAGYLPPINLSFNFVKDEMTHIGNLNDGYLSHLRANCQSPPSGIAQEGRFVRGFKFIIEVIDHYRKFPNSWKG